ncbi:MAG: GAF domain-containing protein, partial [Anaerolineales bacterium]
MTSLVSMPLLSGSQLMGALLAGLHGERRFKPAELRFIMAIAQETAVALESLRLRRELWHTAEALLDGKLVKGEMHAVEQTELDLEVLSLPDLPATAPAIPQTAEEDLEQVLAAMMEAEAEARQQNADLLALNDIAELMNRSLDLKQILACTVDQTRSVSKADAAWIYLVEEENRLVMRAHAGLSPDYVRAMRSLKVGDGLEGRVAAEDEAHFIESTSEDVQTHRIWVEREDLRALAAVPITRPEPERGGDRTEPHIVGVLAVGVRARQAHTWGPRERRLLTSIANHVAPAIDNARLHATVQVDEAGMRAGNQVLQEINDMLLQRNAFLEGLIQDDLVPALVSSARIVHLLRTKNIAPLTDTQIGVCAGAL